MSTHQTARRARRFVVCSGGYEGTMKSMAATMGGSSQRIIESDSEATTLFAPTVRYASTNESQFDPCMDWRAELWLGQLDIVDAPDVLGGYADFLTIRLGEDSIAGMLDSLSQDAENFAGLFDGKYAADSVQDQFREQFSTVLILLTVLVAEPLRGHDLGAWLAAEVIARMASVTDTLVLLYPHPAGETPEDVSEIQAIDALNRDRGRQRMRIGDQIVADIEKRHAAMLGPAAYADFIQALRAITRDDVSTDE